MGTACSRPGSRIEDLVLSGVPRQQLYNAEQNDTKRQPKRFRITGMRPSDQTVNKKIFWGKSYTPTIAPMPAKIT
jgi:hypothetical protein